MGKRGRRPVPPTILKMRGSKRSKDREAGPAATEGRPDPPIFLRPKARAEWKRIVAQLEEMGILGKCDGNALARYCQAIAKYADCEKFLTKNGLTYEQTTREGTKIRKEYPEQKLSSRLSDECRKFENVFGLNPSARTDMGQKRVSSPNENRGKKKPKSRFFGDAG